jgi:hypothetical protein
VDTFCKSSDGLLQQKETIRNNANEELSLDTLDQVSGGLMSPEAYAGKLRGERVMGVQFGIDMKLYEAVYARQVRKDELLSGKPWLNPL